MYFVHESMPGTFRLTSGYSTNKLPHSLGMCRIGEEGVLVHSGVVRASQAPGRASVIDLYIRNSVYNQRTVIVFPAGSHA
jgi:hypothetical protein